MVPVKIECGCGQRYAFDVEPVNGRMPTSVACPACGTDGTEAANDGIAMALAAQPSLAAPAAPPAAPPPPPVGLSRSPVQQSAPGGRTVPPARPNVQKPSRGNDGWSSDETAMNKLGTYVTLTPSILGALLSWGMFGVEVPATIICVVVGVCGLIGGALNVAGRGPMVAGALIGLVMGLGGYGGVYWWIHDRESAYKFEIGIAFVLGALPGFLLQYVLQYWLRKKAAANG